MMILFVKWLVHETELYRISLSIIILFIIIRWILEFMTIDIIVFAMISVNTGIILMNIIVAYWIFMNIIVAYWIS